MPCHPLFENQMLSYQTHYATFRKSLRHNSNSALNTVYFIIPFPDSSAPFGHPILPGTGIPLLPDSLCILRQYRPQPSGQSTLQRVNIQSPIVFAKGIQTPSVSPARSSPPHCKGCLWQYSLFLKFLSSFSTLN